MHALLFSPAQSGPHSYPGIIACHGGVDGIDENFAGRCEELASHGFAVLAPSFRGEGESEGPKDVGKGDVADTLRAAEVLQGAAPAAGEKIGIWGNSRGGLVTLLAIEQSRQFAAAVVTASIVSIRDLYNVFHRRNDPALSWFLKALGGTPEERPGAYDEREPLRFIQRIECPLLGLHGDADTVIPVEAAHRLLHELQGRGKHPYEVKTFPGAGHRFVLEDTPTGKAARERIARFFKAQLG